MPSDVTRTRHILQQTRRNTDEIVGLRAETRQEFGRAWQEFASLRQDLTGLRGMIAGLTTNLPSMIADVMRQVLRERDSKA